MSAPARSVALCVAETRSLTRTAEAMRAALEAGDTRRLQSLVEIQETGIWRLGRLMKGEDLESGDQPEDLWEAAEAGDAEGLSRALACEMQSLAEVSRQNAVLLRDGLKSVRGMLAILTGRYDEYGRGAQGSPGAFSRRA